MKKKTKGIYIFYNKNYVPVYIGQSKDNLIKRSIQSYKLRKDEIKYVSYSITELSEVDIDIYEIYLINKFKPDCNIKSKSIDNSSLNLPIIEFTEPAIIYTSRNGKIYSSMQFEGSSRYITYAEDSLIAIYEFMDA